MEEISLLAVDVTGREYQSGWWETNPQDTEATKGILREFQRADHLALDTAEGKVYLNPRHVVSVRMSTR